MKIKATCKDLNKTSVVSRALLRKAMMAWGWDQCKSDYHLTLLEVGKTLTINTPQGQLVLSPF